MKNAQVQVIKPSVFFALSFLSAVLTRDSLSAPATELSGSLQELQPTALSQKWVQEARELKLWMDPQWLKLGHYQKTFLGRLKSEAAGSAFFVSPQGESDPQAEMEATLLALVNPEPREYEALYPDSQGNRMERQRVHCQFPARVLFFRKHLKSMQSQENRFDWSEGCEKFEDFKRVASAQSVSLVFSSYYLNSPSSAFGHTFLRLNRHPLGTPASQRGELLDRGINFAADVTTQNALFYAFLGLSGGFRGTYSNVPYYLKVREYNDFESRDLWSYDLNLSSIEIELLVAHLWELGHTYFQYFYLSKNCSYQILTALEAAAPRFELVSKLPFYVIPSDTVKAVTTSPGVVHSIWLRPSAVTRVQDQLKSLTEEEQKEVFEIAVRKSRSSPLGERSEERKILILDAALEYWDATYPEEIAKSEPEASRWRFELLKARAALGPRTADSSALLREVREDASAPGGREVNEPHLSHPSRRVSLRAGTDSARGPYVGLGYRFALHDVLDPSRGYPALSQLEFGHAQGRFAVNEKEFQVDRIQLLELFSITPRSRFSKPWSWAFQLGATRREENWSNRKLALQTQVAGGQAWRGPGSLALYAMLGAQIAYSSGFTDSKWELPIGPWLGAIWDGARLKVHQRLSLELSPLHIRKSEGEPALSESVFKSYLNLQSRTEVRWIIGRDRALASEFGFNSHGFWSVGLNALGYF